MHEHRVWHPIVSFARLCIIISVLSTGIGVGVIARGTGGVSLVVTLLILSAGVVALVQQTLP